jgi:NADH pyrophosphatase NudC (nudix superfamily)
MEELLKDTKEAVQRMAIALETLVGEMVKARVSKEFEQEKPQIAQSNYQQSPMCPVCGAGMKPSKKGTKWLCVNSKWRMVNGKYENLGTCDGSLDR